MCLQAIIQVSQLDQHLTQQPPNPKTSTKMRRNTCNRMWDDCGAIHQIAIQVDVNDIVNGMTRIIDILGTLSISISCLAALTNGFDGIDLKLHKVSEYECVYRNNMDTIAITNNSYKIGTALLVGLLLITIYSIMQLIDALLVNIIPSIEFNVIITVVDELISILAAQSLITAVDCNKQIICNVCNILLSVFICLQFLCL